MIILLVLTIVLLAWSNGANDIFKGVASLHGSGAASYRTALGWGIISTAAGSLAAIMLAAGLLNKFSGKGLVPDEVFATPAFVVSVALGAGVTVLLASLLGFPISTTHALTGAMLGSGWMAVGSAVQLGVLGKGFLLPLLSSPMIAVIVGAFIYGAFHAVRVCLKIPKQWCFCYGAEQRMLPVPHPVSLFSSQEASPLMSASCGTVMECKEKYGGRVIGIDSQRVVDGAHFVSAGVVGFARGLNDTPKMAALLLAVPQMKVPVAMGLIVAAMSVGGLMGARKVAETMSHKITTMNHGQGFSANLGTGLIVTLASLLGMPVSTTHVSVGALFGIGMVNGQANGAMIRKIVMSWLITLPCAALAGMLVFAITRWI